MSATPRPELSAALPYGESQSGVAKNARPRTPFRLMKTPGVRQHAGPLGLRWSSGLRKGVEIAKIFGRTSGAISQLVRRTEARMASDGAIRSGLDEIRRQLEGPEVADSEPEATILPDDWLCRETLGPRRQDRSNRQLPSPDRRV
jgi:hypothetical protein